jgi:hypothetical protein
MCGEAAHITSHRHKGSRSAIGRLAICQAPIAS